ncbi:ATP-grasp domain-containing protein [Sorangium sp. So ce726]|uniref:ATP-grasp domain-containing protein n=1 Tax=Sorangium sp. So ce726 TaxID=3133319 RepID=UPI003F60870C
MGTQHVVIIEAARSGAGLKIVESAVRLGWEVTFVTDDVERYTPFYGRHSILGRLPRGRVLGVGQSTSAPCLARALSDLRRAHPFDGIACLVDRNIEAAAAVAEEMRCPHIPAQAARDARNKHRLRQLSAQHGIPGPRFGVVEHAGAARRLAQEWGYPLVLKSSRGTGSQEVRLCQGADEVDATFPVIREMALEAGGQVLAEEFLRGPLVSVETLTFRGETRILGVTSRILGTFPSFVELAAAFPVLLPEPLRRRVDDLVVRTLRALGVTHGPAHTELVLTADGPALIEVNPRLAGGLIGPMISEAYRADVHEQILRMAVGEAPALPAAPSAGACEYYVYAATHGRLRSIRGVELARGYPGVLGVTVTASPGAQVSPPTDWRGELAVIYARGENAAIAESNCLAALSAIQVEIG